MRWTRTDGTKTSILDYVIVDKDDEELIKEMLIDEEREITPNHFVEGRNIYTDHYTIKLEVNWNMRFKPGENKRMIITEDSNAEFKDKTEESNLQQIWETEATHQEKYSLWSKEVSRLAESIYFKKKKKKKEMKAIRMLRNRKKEIKASYKEATPAEKEIL